MLDDITFKTFIRLTTLISIDFLVTAKKDNNILLGNCTNTIRITLGAKYEK